MLSVPLLLWWKSKGIARLRCHYSLPYPAAFYQSRETCSERKFGRSPEGGGDFYRQGRGATQVASILVCLFACLQACKLTSTHACLNLLEHIRQNHPPLTRGSAVPPTCLLLLACQHAYKHANILAFSQNVQGSAPRGEGSPKTRECLFACVHVCKMIYPAAKVWPGTQCLFTRESVL